MSNLQKINTLMNHLFLLIHALFLFGLFSFGQVDSTDYEHEAIQEIEEVMVSSNFGEIVFEDSKHFIIDFHISELGRYVILKHMRHYQLLKLNSELAVISTMKLDFKPTTLFSDCLGNLHVLSKDSMYQLNIYSEQLSIFERNTIDLYYDFFEKCIGRSDQYVYMKEMNDFGQSTILYAFNREKGVKQLIYRIEDSVVVADVNLEYQGILNNSHLETQRMQEISIPQLYGSRDHTERVFYFIQVLSKSDYNPTFFKGDTLFVFDHVNGLAVQLADSGTVLGTSIIDYHLFKNWQARNHLDTRKNQFYTEYSALERNVSELSSNNYHLGKSTKLTEQPQPDKLVIFDGYAYFTYKPNFGANLNKLYRQRL